MRVRLAVLRVLFLVFAAWIVTTAVVAAQQRALRNDPDPCNAQLLVAQAQNQNVSSLAAVDKRLAVVEGALEELKEMRKLIYGIAGTLLMSLLMQVAQLKRVKT